MYREARHVGPYVNYDRALLARHNISARNNNVPTSLSSFDDCAMSSMNGMKWLTIACVCCNIVVVTVVIRCCRLSLLLFVADVAVCVVCACVDCDKHKSKSMSLWNRCETNAATRHEKSHSHCETYLCMSKPCLMETTTTCEIEKHVEKNNQQIVTRGTQLRFN